MWFSKRYLRERIDDAVSDRVVGRSRWEETHEMVFDHEEQYYIVRYTRGLTELQDTQPFQYDPEHIDCAEAEEVEVVSKVWRRKEDPEDLTATIDVLRLVKDPPPPTPALIALMHRTK